MKELWEQIERTIAAAILNEDEKANVKDKLDRTIGSYLIEDVIPVERGELTENEFVVYREIMEATFAPKATPQEMKDVTQAMKDMLRKIGGSTHVTSGRSSVEGRWEVDKTAAMWGAVTLHRTYGGWNITVWADDYPKTNNKRGKDADEVIAWLNSIRREADLWKK